MYIKEHLTLKNISQYTLTPLLSTHQNCIFIKLYICNKTQEPYSKNDNVFLTYINVTTNE